MNQKGFIIAPVILWILGALVLTSTVVVKEGLIPLDLSEKITHDGSRTGARVGYQSYCNPEQGVVIYENEKMPFITDEGEQVLWTQGDIDCYKERKLAEKNNQVPIPTSTPKPKPTTDLDPIVTCLIHKDCGGGSIQLKNSICSNSTCCQIGDKRIFYQSKSKCTQDQAIGGSRTGKIVKYKEYCSGGVEISVYDNELVTKKASDGNTYSMTQKDWGCFENSLKNKPNQAITTTNSKPVGVATITCVMPYGTFQVPQVHCDNAKAILRDQESIKKNFNENMERIRQESDRKLEEIRNRTFQPSYTVPTFPTPIPLKIEVEPEPCVVVPPGFGGATSGRVNEAGFPCAN